MNGTPDKEAEAQNIIKVHSWVTKKSKNRKGELVLHSWVDKVESQGTEEEISPGANFRFVFCSTLCGSPFFNACVFYEHTLALSLFSTLYFRCIFK